MPALRRPRKGKVAGPAQQASAAWGCSWRNEGIPGTSEQDGGLNPQLSPLPGSCTDYSPNCQSTQRRWKTKQTSGCTRNYEATVEQPQGRSQGGSALQEPPKRQAPIPRASSPEPPGPPHAPGTRRTDAGRGGEGGTDSRKTSLNVMGAPWCLPRAAAGERNHAGPGVSPRGPPHGRSHPRSLQSHVGPGSQPPPFPAARAAFRRRQRAECLRQGCAAAEHSYLRKTPSTPRLESPAPCSGCRGHARPAHQTRLKIHLSPENGEPRGTAKPCQSPSPSSNP